MKNIDLSRESIKVASPCHANWAEMTGDERVRFCAGCRKNVYKLSAMTREEASALFHEKDGRLCVRFYRRPDGTVLTSDCPVGVAAIRKKLLKVAAMLVGLLSFAGPGCRESEQGELSPASTTTLAPAPIIPQDPGFPAIMGDVALPVPPSPPPEGVTTNAHVFMGKIAVPNPDDSRQIMGEVSVQ